MGPMKKPTAHSGKPPLDKAREYKPDGYRLEVGDRIEASITTIFRRVDVVTRVTATLAICEREGFPPVRYQRIYDSHRFYALPYSRTNVQYRVLA